MQKISSIARRFWKPAAAVAVGLAVALFIFHAGVEVGIRKARFAGSFADGYERNFVGRHGDRPFLPPPMPAGHGAAGKIVSVSLPSIVVADPFDGVEKTVIVGAAEVKRFRDDSTAESLKVGEHIVAIGSPDDAGRIVAEIVRVLPPLDVKAEGNPARE